MYTQVIKQQNEKCNNKKISTRYRRSTEKSVINSSLDIQGRSQEETMPGHDFDDLTGFLR